MSKEFFEIMEKIEKSAKDIKFLENMHPEISGVFLSPATNVLEVISKLELDLISDLRKIHTKPVIKRKNGRPKSKSKD